MAKQAFIAVLLLIAIWTAPTHETAPSVSKEAAIPGKLVEKFQDQTMDMLIRLPQEEADLINEVCAKTIIDPLYCQEALRSDPRSPTADLPTLAEIAIDLAQSETQSAITLIKSLGEGTSDAVLRSIYGSCRENYEDTFENLGDCEAPLENKDYATLNIRASAALYGPVACDDNFYVPPPEPDQLKQSSEHVRELCSVICAIANMLPAKSTTS